MSRSILPTPKGSEFKPIASALLTLFICERGRSRVSARGGADTLGDSVPTSAASGRFSHPELLLQLRAARGIGCEDAVDITMQLRGGHLRLSPQNVFHQSIVDEHILFLQSENGVP